MHDAGAAASDPATILGAGQADLLADDPQQRRFRFDVDFVRLAVDIELNHVVSSRAYAGYSGRPRRSSRAQPSFASRIAEAAARTHSIHASGTNLRMSFS